MDEEFDYTLLMKKMESKKISQIKLASMISIGRTSMNLKLNNKAVFTQTEIRNICSVLKIPDSKVGQYFFTPIVQKTVHKGRSG